MKKLGILLVVATTVCGLSLANASTSKKSYNLLGDAPSGSNIPTVDATSPIPFNVSYVALTEAQKKIVKSKYDNLGVNDTPPFPSRGLKAIYKPVINANRSLGKSGLLKITAIVNKEGLVESVVVHESPSKALSKRATRALRNTQFDAGTCDGEACEMEFPFEIKFQ